MNRIITAMVVVLAMVCTSSLSFIPVQASGPSPSPSPPTPFVIYGWIYDSDGTPVNNPRITLMNNNTGKLYDVETDASSNYYQVVLTGGTDINASEQLRFEVENQGGDRSATVEHTVNSTELNNGGLFNFNISLSAPGQVWYLTSEGKPEGAPKANDNRTHVKDNLMNKGSRTGSGKYFDLNYTEVAWFYANTGAANNLSFGEHAWKAHIRTEKIDGDEIGHNLTVEICRLEHGTGNITVLASNTTRLNETSDTKHLWNLTCEDNESTTQSFNTGDWLAVRLSWDCPTDELRIFYGAEAGNDSYIESPSSDPGYPVPEMSTLLLFATGLTALAMVWFWRRR